MMIVFCKHTPIIFLLFFIVFWNSEIFAQEHHDNDKEFFWKRATELENIGDFANAADFFLRYAHAEPDPLSRGFAYIKAGGCYREISQFDQSLTSYNNALAVFQQQWRVLVDEEIYTLNAIGDIKL